MKTYNYILLYLTLGISIFLITERFIHKTNRIGVINMDKLVYEYNGMKEATNSYQNKLKQWSAKSDSLEVKLNELVNQIKLDSINKDKTKLNNDIKLFIHYRKTLANYIQNTQEHAQNEDKEMTLGVINQINDYIKSFAQESGFDVVLTNAQQQSVGYAKETIDITNEVLEYANKKYEGVK